MAVERLALEAEHRLRVGVADLLDGAAGAVALGEEYHSGVALRILVVVVDLAVGELLVVQGGLFQTLLGLLAEALHRLALFLGGENLGQQHIGHILVLMQVVVQLAAHEVAHELLHRKALLIDHLAAQLHLGLRLEFGLVHTDGDGADYTLTGVGGGEVLLVEFLQCLAYRLAESRHVGTAQDGVLAVYKGMYILAVLVAVGHHYLDVLSGNVDGRIERLLVYIVVQQVQQAVGRFVCLLVVVDGEADIQVGVILDHLHHVLFVEGVALEYLVVGSEDDLGAVALGGGLFALSGEFALGEGGPAGLTVAERLNLEIGRQGVDSLEADAVEADALLVRFVVVLGAAVETTHRHNHSLERDAAAPVAHAHGAVLYGDVNLLAVAAAEFVHRVVYNLLGEDIDTVGRVAAVAAPADVHAGALADMFHVIQVDDALVAVFVLILL